MFKDVWLEQWDGEVKSPRLKSPRSPKSDPLGFDSPRVDEHVDVFDLHQYPQKFVAELMRFIYTDRVRLRSLHLLSSRLLVVSTLSPLPPSFRCFINFSIFSFAFDSCCE